MIPILPGHMIIGVNCNRHFISLPIQLSYEPDDNFSMFVCGSMPLLSTNRGTKRLSNMAIIHLCKADHITAVIPLMNASEPACAQLMCLCTLVETCSVFLEGEKESTLWRKRRHFLPPILLNMCLIEGEEMPSIQCQD